MPVVPVPSAGNCSQHSDVVYPNLVQCNLCSQPRFFKGTKGLNIHIGRIHKDVSYRNDCSTSQFQPSLPNSCPISVNKSFSETLSFFKNNVAIVKRIPRGARITVATSLSKAIRNAISQNSVESWEHLLTFVYFKLHAKKNGNKSLTKIIKSNCTNPTSLDIFSKQNLSFRNIYKKIENKINDGDIKGASNLLFSNDTIAPDSSDTLSALKDKHPTAPLALHLPDPPLPDDNFLQVNMKEVLSALMSFKHGSAGGLDGFTPQHLKDLTCGATGEAGRVLLEDITQLINFMLQGKVNNDITAILYGANICALKKKDGGIRPIAVGCTFRRLASKVCCKHIGSTITEKCSPIQLGFGSKGGCEAAVHATRTFLLNKGGEVLLKLDVKNAFNSVDRGPLLREIKNNVPFIYKYIWQCYSSPSKLMYRNHSISSSVGCQQGDPLGPAIFSLAIHPIISRLNSKLNVWYLDDGTLGGEVSSVLGDLEYLIHKFKGIGLDINFSKCELYINSAISQEEKKQIINKFNFLAPNIKILDKDSLHLLGAPVFADSIPSFAQNQIQNFHNVSDRLFKINSHMALFLIRNCLFAPKFIYFLRCSPFFKFSNILNDIDTIILNTLSSVSNCQISDRAWTQASLPIRYGGLGVRKISSVSLPAFLSSTHSTQDLVSKILSKSLITYDVAYMSEAKSAWVLACPNQNYPKLLHVQKLWDEPLCKLTHESLLNSTDGITERARLLAVSERESGFWLQALPSSNIGTLLDNSTLSLCVCLRLGLKINEPHRCVCGEGVGQSGHHGLSCQRSAGRMSRHASINDVIRRALVTINVPATLEPKGIVRDDGKRPDGLTLVPWKQGRSLVWDATCVDTMAPSHIQATSMRAGAAAESAEAVKRRKYANISQSYMFVPFAVETMGPWGPEAKHFYKELSSRLIEASGDPRAGAYLGQQISLSIQRGNAASILGTLPRGSDLAHLFYL
ncbi:uncharacterized protein [Epargyreus clarus]|uniref:uncharacterized protein n=1 Tax=Epargyreus clarus TaxID=520877 RepID=UPI003C2DA8AC